MTATEIAPVKRRPGRPRKIPQTATESILDYELEGSMGVSKEKAGRGWARQCLMLVLSEEAKTEKAANGKRTTKMRAVMNRLVDLAIGGQVEAIREVIARMDGKIPIAEEEAGGNVVNIQIVKFDGSELAQTSKQLEAKTVSMATVELPTERRQESD